MAFSELAGDRLRQGKNRIEEVDDRQPGLLCFSTGILCPAALSVVTSDDQRGVVDEIVVPAKETFAMVIFRQNDNPVCSVESSVVKVPVFRTKRVYLIAIWNDCMEPDIRADTVSLESKSLVGSPEIKSFRHTAQENAITVVVATTDRLGDSRANFVLSIGSVGTMGDLFGAIAGKCHA